MPAASLALLAIIWAAPAPQPAPPAGSPIAELPGPLVIAGKGNLTKDVQEAFFTLAGKDKAKIVILTATEKGEKLLNDLKGATIRIVVAEAGKHEKVLEDVTGVWVGPGVAGIEKELKKVQARGVVIGGGPALLEFGLLPGFRTKPENGNIGLSLEDGSAIIARGRTLRVIGDKAIAIHVAKGAGHPAATQKANAGSLFDLFQLRRAAANRAAKEPFPPAKPNDPVVEKGALVIVGGGGAGPEIWKKFIELAGGPDAAIVMIPTALEDPIPPAGRITEVNALRRFGAKNVAVLHTRSRTEADDPKFSESLLKAKGVWFGGGRQWRFVDSFENTLTEKRIRAVLARGGVIGGSSAGASIQSEFMPRGHPLGNTVMAAEGYERGFGFLPGCAVDQHFFARKRTGDMTELMKEYPQFLGIGIDEGTALIVTGSRAEVIGRTKVGFYDTRKKPADGKDYEEVKTGETYDLKKRMKVK